MTAVIICEKFGWTWQEYENQPADFLDCIVAKMEAESDVARRQHSKNLHSRTTI